MNRDSNVTAIRRTRSNVQVGPKGTMPRFFLNHSRDTVECRDKENTYHLILFVIVDITDT